MTHWIERIIAAAGRCIRDRFTGELVIRVYFDNGGIRTVKAARETETEI
jgi:hypothetical protein